MPTVVHLTVSKLCALCDWAGRRTAEVHDLCIRTADRVCGVVVGGTPLGAARSIHRMGRPGASPQYPLHCLPESLFNSALGPRSSFSVAHFGTDGSDAAARLGAHL